MSTEVAAVMEVTVFRMWAEELEGGCCHQWKHSSLLLAYIRAADEALTCVPDDTIAALVQPEGADERFCEFLHQPPVCHSRRNARPVRRAFHAVTCSRFKQLSCRLRLN